MSCSVSPLEQNSPRIINLFDGPDDVHSDFIQSLWGNPIHEQWECMFSCLVLLVSLTSFLVGSPKGKQVVR